MATLHDLCCVRFSLTSWTGSFCGMALRSSLAFFFLWSTCTLPRTLWVGNYCVVSCVQRIQARGRRETWLSVESAAAVPRNHMRLVVGTSSATIALRAKSQLMQNTLVHSAIAPLWDWRTSGKRHFPSARADEAASIKTLIQASFFFLWSLIYSCSAFLTQKTQDTHDLKLINLAFYTVAHCRRALLELGLFSEETLACQRQCTGLIWLFWGLVKKADQFRNQIEAVTSVIAWSLSDYWGLSHASFFRGNCGQSTNPARGHQGLYILLYLANLI